MSSGNVYKGFIYYVVCLINGKIYFGQTSRSPEIRWKRHVQRAFNENESYHLHSSKSFYFVHSLQGCTDLCAKCNFTK